MTVPESLWRFPTLIAIKSLAKRLSVPFEPWMQDWEWDIADSARIDEYVSLYNSGDLSDDERFTLMETIIQAFEDLPLSLDVDVRWAETLAILDTNIDLHAYSVWYWSDLEDELGDEGWRVSPYLRRLVERHASRLVPTDVKAGRSSENLGGGTGV